MFSLLLFISMPAAHPGTTAATDVHQRASSLAQHTHASVQETIDLIPTPTKVTPQTCKSAARLSILHQCLANLTATCFLEQ